MEWLTTRPNGMKFILVASLDQCGLSERQIEALAKEGYLTLTNYKLNQYTDINSIVKKFAMSRERGA